MTRPADAPWYAAWFDRDEYDLVYRRRDAQEASRVVDLFERAVRPEHGATLLDVACGRGRHALELARRGYRVTGTDLSAKALAQAQREAEREGLSVHFARMDMREAFCEGCADAVLNLFTAFGYFEEGDDHLRAVRAMAAAMRPGSVLFQDFLNAPYVRATLVPESRRKVGEVEVVEHRWIECGRVEKEIVLRRGSDAHTFRESVRLFEREDFEPLYAASGLTLETTFGDYDGGGWSEQSPRLILLARKEE